MSNKELIEWWESIQSIPGPTGNESEKVVNETIRRLKLAEGMAENLSRIQNLHVCDSTLYTEKENCDKDHEIYEIATASLTSWRQDNVVNKEGSDG